MTTKLKEAMAQRRVLQMMKQTKNRRKQNFEYKDNRMRLDKVDTWRNN